MPANVSAASRLATAATWPLGIAWTSWHYLWRILPVHRVEEDGSLEEDLPPALPAALCRDGIQTPAEGAGPLLHRVYSVSVVDARLGAEELIASLGADPNRIAPRQIARFRKTSGERGRLEVGDEYRVHMPGPWDGPVRAVVNRPDHFRFATLDGHLEAGQIEWRASSGEHLRVTVESWARSGDSLSALLHDRLHMAKEVQLYMWTSLLERIPRIAGGRLLDGVHVRTRRIPPEAFERERRFEAAA